MLRTQNISLSLFPAYQLMRHKPEGDMTTYNVLYLPFNILIPFQLNLVVDLEI